MRLIRRALALLLTLAVLGAGWAVYLAYSAPDPHTASGWARLKDLPRPRGEVAGASTQRVDPGTTGSVERLAVVGGLAGVTAKTVAWVDLYDPQANAWSRGPDLPEPRHHPGAVGTGGVLYVTGGARSATNWKPERQLWFLYANESTWHRGPDMPDGRMGHQMVALGSTLYVVGGRGDTSNILIYDIPTSRWSIGAQMPVKRDHLGAAVLGNKIYAIGGRDRALTARVDVYDPALDAWSPGPTLPRPMSAMAVGTTEEPTAGIQVVGGEDPASIGGGIIDAHYVLAIGAPGWVSASRPIIAVHGAAAGVVLGSLVVAGGAARQGSLSPLAWRGVTQRYDGP